MATPGRNAVLHETHGLANASEAARARAPVTDRVNVEPSILNGMTATEAKVIASVSLAVFALIGGLVLVLTRVWQVMLLLSIFGPVAALWFGSAYLQKVKRGRPDGYYSQAFHLWLVEHSLIRSKFIRHHGYWDLGRTLDFSLASSLEPAPEAAPAPAAAPTRQERARP